eukprot:TRINITY_DN106374_c0_g1_i1.p1 TRINITY_DN106374_c0_g1~~TRINITY_DN106374_c0_g1_i1.p1  ORF type:complete len:475 (+),score=114.94 TRINITY_DN106374_c0_g1_i1:66-1490(+)
MALKAPEWYRDAKGPEGLRPLPPKEIPDVHDEKPKPTASQGATNQPVGRSAVPALPPVPAAPSTALALQPQGQLPPLPALAALPAPPPLPGGLPISQDLTVPSTSLAIAGTSGGKQLAGSQAAAAALGAARVKAAPKGDSEKAFVIPGLQARPYLPEELEVAFEIIDLDRHKEIGSTDIRRALRLCGEPEPTEAEVHEMIRLMDPDGSGSIEFAEFRKYFIDPPPLFRNFDLHRRGGGEMDLEADDPVSGLVDDGRKRTNSKATEPVADRQSTQGSKRKTTRSTTRSKTKDDGSEDPRLQYIPYIAKGGLTPEFIKGVYQRFVEIDETDTGYMSFQAFCTVLGKAQSARMREVFDAFDADREGELDLRQFVIGLSMFATSGLEEKVRFAFMMYDEEQGGSVSREELSELLRAMAPYMRGPHRQAHLERIYAVHNLHPNSRLTHEQLMDYMYENKDMLLPQLTALDMQASAQALP